ncbi:MAG: hypothetical protein KGJ23_09945 [Euryarchaeota archaeon]|nr:hypothetical protein [Euryarchaeota archaeon]MDE1836925.1 hypothetical protein [Euryarchaeota archaeon]MDE1881523.1 hypothetical protein [Euryarchaeota archaeon]MDE2045090.1 hypothetical protein [Thermoplasmata archaeon]
MDPLDNEVYVADGQGNSVSVLNGTSVAATISLGFNSSVIACDARTGYVYLPNFSSNDVVVINRTTILATIWLRTAPNPFQVLFDPVNGLTYVSHETYTNLSVLQGTSLVATVSLPPGGCLTDYLSYDARDGWVYASAYISDCWYVVNRTTYVATIGDPTGGLLTCDGSGPFAFDVGHSTVDADAGCPAVMFLNHTSGTYLRFGSGYTPDSIVYDAATRLMYLASSGALGPNGKTVILLNGSKIDTGVTMWDFATDLLYYPANQTILDLEATGLVQILNGTTLVENLSFGGAFTPFGGTYDSANRYLYVPGGSCNCVYVLGWVPPPMLKSVSVSPPTASLATGASQTFTGSPSCAGSPCPPGTTYSWSTNRPLGSFNSTTGSVVRFTAGGTAGVIYLFLNATLKGVIVQSTPVQVTIFAGLASVSVSPSSAALALGGSQSFTATTSCSGGACPSGTTYSWSTNGPLGYFNATTGSVVKFTAGTTAGTTYLFVNATLNGLTVQSTAVPVSIIASPPPKATVAFYDVPVWCAMDFNGSSRTNASTGSFSFGNYTAFAPTCSGQVFKEFETNVSGVARVSTQNPSTLWVRGNGSVTVVYVPTALAPHNVTFLAQPSTCTWTFNGSLVANDSWGLFTRSNYTAFAPNCPGYVFHGWIWQFHQGSMSWSGTSSVDPVAIQVYGNGTVEAVYWQGTATRLTASFFVTPAACNSLEFNGSLMPNGSSSKFWAGTYPAHALPCAGYTFWNWFVNTGNGSLESFTTPWLNVSIADYASIALHFTRNGALPITAGFTLNRTSVRVGGSVEFDPTISGGTPPYYCLWFPNGTGFLPGLPCGPSSVHFVHTGNYTYFLLVEDSLDVFSNQTAGQVIEVLPPLSAPPPLVAFANYTWIGGAVCSESPETATVSGNARGGVPPYTFAWSFGDGGNAVIGRNVTHTFQRWPLTASLFVTDARGLHAWANLTVQVVAATCPPPAPPHFSLFGLSTSASILLVVLPIAAAAVILTLLLVSRRRRRDLSPPPTPEPSDAPPPDPATIAPQQERPNG